jgi:hypothetical protein
MQECGRAGVWPVGEASLSICAGDLEPRPWAVRALRYFLASETSILVVVRSPPCSFATNQPDAHQIHVKNNELIPRKNETPFQLCTHL